MLPALTFVSIVGSSDCGQAVWTTVRGRPGLVGVCAMPRPATSALPAPAAAKRRNSRRLVLWRVICSPFAWVRDLLRNLEMVEYDGKLVSLLTCSDPC